MAYFREAAHKADTHSSSAAPFLCLSVSRRDATVPLCDGAPGARVRLCSFDTEIVVTYLFPETKEALVKESCLESEAEQRESSQIREHYRV